MSAPQGHGTGKADELDADEPRTPLWLPLLGLCLFLAAFTYALVSNKDADDAKPAAEPEAAAEPAASADPGH